MPIQLFSARFITRILIGINAALLASSTLAYAQSTPSPSPSPESSATSSSPVEVDRLEDGILYFKDNTPGPLKTNLSEAELLGVLRPLPGGDPFAILSGKTCKNCLADSGLFALPPSGGKPSGYLYPGKIFESKSRALVYEARAFFGHCMPRRPHDVLIIFQREVVDRRHGLLKSVMIAEPPITHAGDHATGSQSHLRETLLEAHLPALNETLALVKRHQCTEIQGRNRVMLKKPLDVQLRRDQMRDDEDSDKTDDEDGSN